MGDGGVETKKKEAGDAGGRQRPVTQRYKKEKEGRSSLDRSET